MSESWFVMYDGPALNNQHGYEESVTLFHNEDEANIFFNIRKDYLLKQAQWESGRSDGGDYFTDLPEYNQVLWCGHIGLWLGKAEYYD